MPTQPAILGTARLNNFRLGYQPAALAAARESRATVLIAGALAKVRKGSVTIRDILNDAPNTCSLIVNKETPPIQGQRIRITVNSDTPVLLFEGALETVAESYEGGRSVNLAYSCTAQDDTPRANRRIPLGYWSLVSATTVAQELVANFAPGFTTTNVQAGLPAITVHFEGSEAGMNGCLRQIAKLIGGYFYWESRDLHLFTAETTNLPDDIDTTPNRFLNDPAITIRYDDSQIRTRVFGKGHQESSLADIAVGVTVIPLGDVSMYNPAGGKVISESQILTYTGTAVGGGGALVGTTVTPTSGPTVAKRATTGLSSGTHQWAFLFGTASGRTLLGPATSATLGDAVAAPASTPTVARTAGGNLTASGIYKWKVAYLTALGETLASIESAALTMDPAIAAPTNAPITARTQRAGAQLDVDPALYQYKYTFWDGATRETTPSPASIAQSTDATDAAFAVQISTLDAPPSGFQHRFYRTEGSGSTYLRLPSGQAQGQFSEISAGFYIDIKSDTELGAAAPTSTSVYRSASLTAIPVSSNALVTKRRIYRTAANGSTFKVVADINDNATTTYADSLADASLGSTELSTATALNNAADLTGITAGPSGTTYREVYRKPPGGADFKLLTTLANNTTTTFTDTTPDASLGAVAPTTDTSGLVAQSGDVPAGSTSMLVTSTGFAVSGGGWAFIGSLPIRYTGTSGNSITGIPASGPGSLTTTVRYGSEIIATSMLTGVSGLVRPLIKGAPIHIWVQRDDTAAQAELAAREGEGDGIIEHRIVDERRGEASLIALCNADLAQFSRPLVTVTYATRDLKTKSGKPIVIDLPSPVINKTLTIQEVTIDQIDIAPGLAPRFSVVASSLRYTVDDLLRRMASALEGQ
jgi:hypothetical protein